MIINTNGSSGSGGLPEVTSADNGKVLMVVNGVWTKADPMVWSDYIKIGGRIFYDDGGYNGWNYKFYDSSKTEITDTTISGLANAYYYRYQLLNIKSKDRWFVYDNNTNLISDKSWGKYSTKTDITLNTIGSGKTNTATMMSMNPDGTMWTWLRDTINGGNVGGCSDWFIASMAEQDKLRTSGLVDWYNDKYIWSSVEMGASNAYYWEPTNNRWYSYRLKSESTHCAFAMRSF